MAVFRSRRRFLRGGLALAGLGLLAGCELPRLPWQAAKVPRIGFLALKNVGFDSLEVIRDALREQGYIEGRTLAIEERRAESPEQLPALAVELVGLPVDVIVTSGSSAVQAAIGATRTIPIVFTAAADPVRTGFVDGLARPRGNATGPSEMTPQIQGKRLQLLRELAPGASRVMFLSITADAEASGTLRESDQAAQSLGMTLLAPNIRDAADLLAAFELAVSERAEALLVTGNPRMIAELGRIIAFSTTARLPLLSQDRIFPEAGGLISYGPSRPALYRLAATYVDKILKGAKPADLPVEQPTTFDLVLNLKTAQALGLTIPQSVLLQTTEIIQ